MQTTVETPRVNSPAAPRSLRGTESVDMLRRPSSSDFYARRLPWKRSLQSLLTPEQMAIAIERESARADRSGGEFAMVLFRLQNLDRQSNSTVRVAKTILKRVRATDDVGWYDDQNIGVLLPDTSAAGAWRFADQVCALVEKKQTRPICSVYCYPQYIGNGEAKGSGVPHPGNTDNGNGNGNSDGNGTSHRFADVTLLETGATGNGIANGHANGHANGNANGNGHKLGVGNLIPYFLDGVATGGESRPTIVHRLQTLLVRPLPLWKRAIDITGASIGLFLLSPFMAAAAIAIKLTSSGPVIFTQQRAGLGGKPFTIFKFRTMCIDAEAKKEELRKLSEQDGPAFKLTNDPRVTKVGTFLRKTSIDELPQLWTVIKGDMTRVGPRPLPLNESERCSGWQRRRLDVTPGLTCIWQVTGRSTVSFADWVRMDVAYIRRRTFWNDLRILVQTVPAVLMRKGAR